MHTSADDAAKAAANKLTQGDDLQLVSTQSRAAVHCQEQLIGNAVKGLMLDPRLLCKSTYTLNMLQLINAVWYYEWQQSGHCDWCCPTRWSPLMCHCADGRAPVALLLMSLQSWCRGKVRLGRAWTTSQRQWQCDAAEE